MHPDLGVDARELAVERLREELERLLVAAKMGEFVEKLARLRQNTPSSQRRQVLGEAVSGVHFSGELKL